MRRNHIFPKILFPGMRKNDSIRSVFLFLFVFLVLFPCFSFAGISSTFNILLGDANKFGCPCSESDGAFDVAAGCFCVEGVCDRLRTAEEFCDKNEQCFSGNCFQGVCLGVGKGGNCTYPNVGDTARNPCAKRFYCRKQALTATEGVCVDSEDPGEACDMYSFLLGGCSAGTECDFDFGTMTGTCKEMYNTPENQACGEVHDRVCMADLVCFDGECEKTTGRCYADADCPVLKTCNPTTGACVDKYDQTKMNECTNSIKNMGGCLETNGCYLEIGGGATQSGSCKSACIKYIIDASCCMYGSSNQPSGVDCETSTYTPPADAFCKKKEGGGSDDKKKDKGPLCFVCVGMMVLGVLLWASAVSMWIIGRKRRAPGFRITSIVFAVAGAVSIVAGLVGEFHPSLTCDVCLFAFLGEFPLILLFGISMVAYRKGCCPTSVRQMFDDYAQTYEEMEMEKIHEGAGDTGAVDFATR